jgi:2-polyprenyl-6-hydroxyphenyl methylase/3-demethylubiquinone-9 3-methyltransferase
MANSQPMSSIKWKLAQYLEIRWWQRYLRNKPVEEYLTWKRNYWHGFLEKIYLEIPDSASVLDAGCGPAGIFTILEKQQVTAIDPLLDRYAREIPHFDKNQYPRVQFHTAGLEDWPSNQQFDYIFCINAINHVNDIKAAARNLRQLLKPGGKLILSIDTHNYSFLKWIFKLIPGDALHPHQMDLEEYVSLLNEVGFEVQERICLEKGVVFGYWVVVGG